MEAGEKITRNALLISLSAFFADFGYQTVVASLPVLLVVVLHAPVYVFGIVVAVSYGLGAIFGYAGGLLSGRYGKKKVTIFGNLLIPILSLSGLATSFYEASVLFTGGWLSRNFRSPARRAMIDDEVSGKNRTAVYGFLNAMDVGGGVLSISVLLSLLYFGVGLRSIILLTAIPILFSSFLLFFVKERKGVSRAAYKIKKNVGTRMRLNRNAFFGVIIATSLYGFSFYSLGFPILTVARYSGNNSLGYLSYLFFLLGSALFGYYVGRKRIAPAYGLGILGYLLSGIATALLGISYLLNLGVVPMYLSILLIGMGVGVIDTLEPSIISIVKAGDIGKGMGSLTASRSVGLLVGNVIMGVLYHFNPAYSYAYAAALSVAAALIVIVFGRGIS